MTQLRRRSYSDIQNVFLSCFRWITVENISTERTGEARWQLTGILLKLQHVDIHVHHLPSLSTRSLFAITTLSIHQSSAKSNNHPFFWLSDAKAIRLANVIGPVKESFTQKMEIIYSSSCLSNPTPKSYFVVVHIMKVNGIQHFFDCKISSFVFVRRKRVIRVSK